MMGLGRAIDDLVGLLSPERAARRRVFRRLLASDAKRTAAYAAAGSSRMTGAWSPTEAGVNEIIGNSALTVRARVRQLVRDFPYFSKAAEATADHVVGDGISFQSRVMAPDGKKINTRLAQQIEDQFSFWMEQADISGRLHYYELMRLDKRQDFECGEFILIVRESREPGRVIPLAFQAVEPDLLTSSGTTPAGRSTEIEQGIEYEKSTGRVVRYHFTDPDGWGRTVSVDASRVIHKFDTVRPNQLRGISCMAPAVIVSNSIHDLITSEVDAARMASKYLAIVKRDLSLGDGRFYQDSEGKQLEYLENSIIEYLNAGEDITIASNPRPGANFPPTVRFLLCMIAITSGIPYEILSGDYQGLNYNTTRTSRNDFAIHLRPIAGRVVRHFCIPTFRLAMDQLVTRGRLSLPGYYTNPMPYLKSEWHPPGMEAIDPLREAKAHVDQFKNMMMSPQELARKRGKNSEDILAEIKEFYRQVVEMSVELGIPWEVLLGGRSTALKNNPADIMDNQNQGAQRGEKITPLYRTR